MTRVLMLDGAVLDDVAALRAAGWRVELAMNQEHLRARDLMDRLGLGRRVDGICYSAALGAAKPAPAFFARAAAGLSGKRPILVDDSAANVAAARDAGWDALHWTGQTRLSALVGG